MFKDVLIPSQIGDSYLFSKRIVSFEITQIAVHGILIVCKGNNVVVQNKVSIILKDFSTATVVGAIKKIVSTIGKHDEVVTALSSASVVFKELQLPFIGHEKIEMIIGYEVEALLPFTLDQAVIDFIVTDENVAKGTSTILVAAALKQDVDTQLSLFEKAGVALHLMTVDMFALSNLYKQGFYVASIDQKNKKIKKHHVSILDRSKSLLFKLTRGKLGSAIKIVESEQFDAVTHSSASSVEMFVDIGFDAIRILYFSSGILKSVRAVPYGVTDIIQAISKKLEAPYLDITQQILYKENSDVYGAEIQLELLTLFGHIVRTQSFFESQIKDGYKKPQKIIFSGLGCSLFNFWQAAQNFFDMPISGIDKSLLFKTLHIASLKSQDDANGYGIVNLATALFGKYNDSCNLLKSFASKADNVLFYKQFGMVLLLTIGCVGGILWHSVSELQRWDSAYLVSKKELTTTLEKVMGIDVKKERNLKDIVTRAQETLKNQRKLWFSFSKETELSYLEFLQDLSIHIDRDAIGLDLKKLSMTPEKVTLSGALAGNEADGVNPFEALAVFAKELSELELLQLVEESRDPKLFTIELKVKDRKQNDVN